MVDPCVHGRSLSAAIELLLLRCAHLGHRVVGTIEFAITVGSLLLGGRRYLVLLGFVRGMLHLGLRHVGMHVSRRGRPAIHGSRTLVARMLGRVEGTSRVACARSRLPTLIHMHGVSSGHHVSRHHVLVHCCLLRGLRGIIHTIILHQEILVIVIQLLKLRLARAVVDGCESLVLALLLSAVLLGRKAVPFVVSPRINGAELGRVVELLLDQHLMLLYGLRSPGLCHRLIVAILVNVELVLASTDDSDVVGLAAQMVGEMAAGVGLFRGELHEAAPIRLLLRPVLWVIFDLLTGGCAAGRVLSGRRHVCLVL